MMQQHQARIEGLVDRGDSLASVELEIQALNLTEQETQELLTWAWAWHESRPNRRRFTPRLQRILAPSI